MLHKKYNLPDIVKTAVRSREHQYWHRDGVIEKAIAAAEAVEYQGENAMIDAIERVIIEGEFICDFDDPCDSWKFYASTR